MKLKKCSAKQLFLGIEIAFIMQLILYPCLIIFGYAKFVGSDFTNYPVCNLLISILVAFIIGVSAGFAEELLFRGVILKYLMNKRGKVFALIVSSLAFAIFHIGRADSISVMVQAFLVGIIYGYLYIITDSVYLSIGVHAGWNFFIGIIQGGGSTFSIGNVFSINIANSTASFIAPILVSLVVLIILIKCKLREPINWFP